MPLALPHQSPESLRFGLASLLRAAVASGLTPGAQLEVGTASGPLFSHHTGHLGWAEYAPPDEAADPSDPPAITDNTSFDLASVTKPLSIGAGAARAIAAKRLGDTCLGDMRQRLSVRVPADKAALRLDDLLSHRAGFVNWLPLYDRMPLALRGTLAGRDWTRAEILRHPLEAPPGTRERYTDLGYILLAWALESVMGAPLHELFAQHVAAPLGLTQTRYVARAWGDARLTDAVWSEVVDWRGGLVRGEVHDDNTAAMGGVSGHAGLFAPAHEVGRIAQTLLLIDSGDEAATAWLPTDTLRTFWSREPLRSELRSELRPETPTEHHLLAWDSPSGDISGAGLTCTRLQTVGHLGFTGTSLWIDRGRGSYVVLLTSRVHPARDAPRIRALRPLIHDTAWALDAL